MKTNKITSLNEKRDQIQIDGIWPIVKPGTYEAELLYHETNNKAFKQPKVYLVFRLLDPGVMGLELYAAFNVKELVGKPGKHGRFRLSRRQDLTFLLLTLNPSMRLDRVSTQFLKNRVLKVKVRTVKTDYRQRNLPEALRYSVVDTILSIE